MFNSNAIGFVAYQLDQSAGAELLLEDVTASYNSPGEGLRQGQGISISGTGMTLRNVEAHRNHQSGILIRGYYYLGNSNGTDGLISITLEGLINSTENGKYSDHIALSNISSVYNTGYDGISITSYGGVPTVGSVSIKGEIFANSNGQFGFSIPDPETNVTVSNDASLTACENADIDIFNNSSSRFVTLSSQSYTCDSDLVICNKCPVSLN